VVCYKTPMMAPVPAARVHRGAAFALTLGLFVVAACSSDPLSDLGSDDDLIASKPGTVREDTLELYADTVLTYYSVIAYATELDFGRASGYERAMVIQLSFAGASTDSVMSADLRLTAAAIDGTVPARFYRLADTYAEGDSIPSLDTLSVILDPGTGSPNRALQTVPREYALPADLVQGWFRGTVERTAIAIVYTDEVNDETATFKSRQASSDRPLLAVDFLNAADQNYATSGDADFIRPTSIASNLVVSDGYVRRIYFRIPIAQLDPTAAVHDARVRLSLVPGSGLGDHPNLIVFVPGSDDVTSPAFRSGQLVTTVTFDDSKSYLEFSVTNALALTLDGSLDDNGLVVRFDAENTELRQVEFYGSGAADSLRPRIFVTSSTPADWHPPEAP
jgi:hypothetical protein